MKYLVFLLYKTPGSLKLDNRNLHNNVLVIFKQLKTVQNVYFSYLEAGDIIYLSFRISKDSELHRKMAELAKWPNYPAILTLCDN